MHKTVLAVAGIAAVFGSFPANAADLRVSKAPAAVIAPAPYYNWGGFYIGGHVGGLWSDKEASTNIDVPRHGNCDGGYIAAPTTCQSARQLSLHHGYEVDGFLAGGQIGYNWHLSPNWVIGVEGQMSWTNADGDSGDVKVGPVDVNERLLTVTGSMKSEVNWIATATGRIGYAVNNMLFYVKGGAAWIDEDHSGRITARLNDVDHSHLFSFGDTRSGWIVGGGVEYGLGNNWSAKLEYNYMDFGNERHTVNHVDFGSHSFDIDQQVHVVKFGINYRFGGWVNPVVARY